MSLVSNAVAIANSVTRSLQLQSTVTLEKPGLTDGYGRKLAPVITTPSAVVEVKQQMVKSQTGELVPSRASVLFLDPSVTVDLSKDKITLPDGTTGPILSVEGFVDGATNQRALTQVYLG